VLGALGVIAVGAVAERLADLLIPGRRTGLGAEGIVDEHGVVVRAFTSAGPGREPEGTVQVAGELWRARTARPDDRAPPEGSAVRVVGVQGMVALVEAVGGEEGG